MSSLSGHRFGGNWTERKLEAVRYYLEFYATALSKQQFDLWYIDAFAGSGERTETRTSGGLLEEKSIGIEDVVLDGSAKRAMAVTPPFKHLIFMEPDTARYQVLCKLRDIDARVECQQGDANTLLPDIFARSAWRRAGKAKGTQRGVVFLDPYGMQVSWETLELLAATQRVDVWYLFPLGAVNRQLAHDAGAIDEHKQASLNRLFGGSAWRSDLYEPDPRTPLFGPPADDQRAATLEQIETYFHRKLEGLFSWASPPLPLFLDGGQQVFSLFLLIANDSPAAIQLAKNGMRDLLRKHERQAFRRRSVP
ncbi:three-Cys-motif partner protein TcmP [Phenylobacterium sp. LH3H17]|uniref:three-Cys-motif partner protein TcmP n=1 Tax=Phenylobacterium sp. LH3H17 TaxID=2903901 RepID=UPI0020CA1932|nr:three-Cys-motif partner protein TcmP [Phenylobacterium sp. LH3H17]UTP40467.1 three-Cys-motif partner protein TcmP [Phenylobacterium sp. LH3H17]